MKTKNLNTVRSGFLPFSVAVALVSFALIQGCSSSPSVKSQDYAKLKTETVFEYEFPQVWRGIEAAVRGLKITDRDPNEVDEVEMKKLRERTLKTDWIFSKSREKFIEYKVNGLPRKQYLQNRVKFEIQAERVMGGVKVAVFQEEEIERLNADGTPAGYESAGSEDTARANELLGKIKTAILAAP